MNCGMHVAHVIRSRKVSAWAVVIALAILVILIEVAFLQSRRSPKRLKWRNCTAYLD